MAPSKQPGYKPAELEGAEIADTAKAPAAYRGRFAGFPAEARHTAVNCLHQLKQPLSHQFQETTFVDLQKEHLPRMRLLSKTGQMLF
ncbi:MAG: hypothetical protein ACKO96_42560, partial [Flammeovirgaceae bacterium]